MTAPAAGPVERRPYRTWVEISLPQIVANFQEIRSLLGPDVEVMPVVKADAYRHGAVEISRVLEREGTNWLAVSNTDEGVVLRDAGIACRILVMADFLPPTRETLLERQLTPVLHLLEDVAELERIAVTRGLTHVPYHLKVDTGMGRLGVQADGASIVQAVQAAPHLRLEGLMTHFASAGDYESNQTDEQTKCFNRVADYLAEAGIHPDLLHLSSTIPVAYKRTASWGTGWPNARPLVRPGHAIYGYVSPARGHGIANVLQVKPALTWRASVLSIKEIPAGSRVGYGGMFQAQRPTRIAVLAVGYADGLPHRLSNRGQVIVQGQLAPILGAVSMDLTTVDVSAAPSLQIGDPVTLLGTEGSTTVDAQQIAKVAGTISYSVLCGIHARVKRIYL